MRHIIAGIAILLWAAAAQADKIREQALIEGRRETLLRQLTAKFGAPSEETRSRIQALESAEELDTYLERILTASSIEDMGLGS